MTGVLTLVESWAVVAGIGVIGWALARALGAIGGDR